MRVITDLALDIVLEEFGPTCHSVAESLVVLGPSTIPDLVKYVSSLPNYASAEANATTRVRAALASLILHNMVSVRVRVRHKEAAALLSSRSSAPTRKRKRKDEGDKGGRAVVSYPHVTTLDPSYSTSSLRYEFKPLAAIRRVRNARLIHVAAKIMKSLQLEASVILLTLVQRGAWHKTGIIECSLRLLQKKTQKVLFSEDVAQFANPRSEKQDEGDEEDGESGGESGGESEGEGALTPEPPITESDIASAAKKLRLEKEAAAFANEYPFYASLTPQGRIALLRVERAWRDMLPLRFIAAAEGLSAQPYPRYLLASNIPPHQRFFTSATSSSSTTATATATATGPTGANANASRDSGQTDGSAPGTKPARDVTDIKTEAVTGTREPRQLRKRKLSEISFSSDVSDVSSGEEEGEEIGAASAPGTGAIPGTVPVRGSAGSAASATSAAGSFAKLEGPSVASLVGQHNLASIYGDSLDEYDHVGAVPGVASPAAGSAGLLPKDTLWRFGWEAATAHVVNSILARYTGSVVPGSRGDMLHAVTVMEAMLFVAEVKSSTAGKATLVSSLIGNIDDDANTDTTSLTPPELSPAVSIREILAQLNSTDDHEAEGDSKHVWTAEQLRAPLDGLIKQPNPYIQVETYGEGGSLVSLGTKVRFCYSKAILAVQLRAFQQWVQEKYMFLTPPTNANANTPPPSHAGPPSVLAMGPLAGRAVRLLLEKGGMLEEKQIADLLLVDQKTVRVVLFRLFQDGLVSMVDVPKRPDRNPQTSLFLFEASWTHLMPLVSRLTCRAILNLRIRRRLEYVRCNRAWKSFHELVKAIRADEGAEQGAAEDQGHGENLVSASKASESVANRIEGGVARLESTIIRCDESLLIFSELFPIPT